MDMINEAMEIPHFFPNKAIQHDCLVSAYGELTMAHIDESLAINATDRGHLKRHSSLQVTLLGDTPVEGITTILSNH